MRKFFQYLRIVLTVAPTVLYYHFKYMIKFAKHPERYPLEKRYGIARKEISYVINKFKLNYDFKNFDAFTKAEEKTLLISNHLSLIDPLMLIINSEKPITFVAKKEIFKFPFVGKVAKAIEVFPLDRSNIMSQLSEIKKIVTYLKDPTKPSVIIYIEGTRNKNPAEPCLEFHAGTLKIAQMAGCPLIVGATYGSFRILSKKSWLKAYPTFFSVIEKLDPDYVRKTNTSELASLLKEKVDNEVDSFRYKDKVFINNLKVSDKRKELETRVDVRAKA